MLSFQFKAKTLDPRFSVDNIELPPTNPEPTCHFTVAGQEEVESKYIDAALVREIRSDIKNFRLPSWMKRPPRNFGQASHGKLTADQWRTLCTVILVTTLIRTWNHSAENRSLLQNFLDLVISVRWATTRSTSEKHIAIIDFHLKRYLETTVQLYGPSSIVPNHHLSLHLTECLRNFGPVYSWWSFPFERYNGIMQRIKNNGKHGSCNVLAETLPMTHRTTQER